MILNFTLLLFLTHKLSVQIFGDYSFIQGYIVGFLTFTDLGTNLIIIRELSLKHHSSQWVLDRALFLKLLISWPTFAIAIVSILLLDYNATTTLGLLCYSLILLFSPFDVIINWFISELKDRSVAWTNSASLAISFVATLLILNWGGDLVWLVLVLVGQLLIRYGLMYLAFRRQGMHLGFAVDLPYTWGLIRKSIPLALAYLLTSFAASSVLVLLSKVGGSTEVAYYSAGSRFNVIILFMPQALAVAVFPVMVNYYKDTTNKDRLALNQLYNKLRHYLILAAVLLGVTATVFAVPLISFVFGSKYSAGAPVLQVIIWYVALTYVITPGGLLLTACNKQNLNAACQVSGAIILLFCSFVLIPKFAAVGLAVAYIIAGSVSLLMQEWLIYRNLNIRIFSESVRLVLLIGIFVAFCWLISTWPLFLALGLVVAFYFAAMLLLGLIDKNDRNWLLSRIRLLLKRPKAVPPIADLQ